MKKEEEENPMESQWNPVGNVCVEKSAFAPPAFILPAEVMKTDEAENLRIFNNN